MILIEMKHNSSSRTAGNRAVERRSLDEKRWLVECQAGQETRSQNRCNTLSGVGMHSARRKADGKRMLRHTDGIFVDWMSRKCCYYGSDCESGKESEDCV